ncbi:MAG: rod shape-determining protein RodA [Gammaproteobacteria bacterium]|nr:MAG: rod shape-determining protein RodA [Gammaproteobacteria bacterium]
MAMGLTLMGWTALSGLSSNAVAGEMSPSMAGAKVYISNLKDGQSVAPTFKIKFAIEGMKVAPAGTKEKHTGHHHLLIDLAQSPALGQPLPSNANVKHFGKGQTETELTLSPGKHTLQLLLGNYAHVPHSPAVMSQKITITVK